MLAPYRSVPLIMASLKSADCRSQPTTDAPLTGQGYNLQLCRYLQSWGHAVCGQLSRMPLLTNHEQGSSGLVSS